ncbi:MAG: prenyltransferase/squalene oxidase repeat-containing protein [Candidatus Bathyarchaeia archaeon]
MGRFSQSGKIALDMKIEHFNKVLRTEKIVKYVVCRQNSDGGYTFCRGTESNAQDTYYGLAILKMLNASFPNFDQTVNWLRNFVPGDLYSHYYVAKALKLCGREPDERLKEFLLSQFSRMEFNAVDVYVEVASEFETVFMATELAKIANVEINREKIAQWLLGYHNADGGFGAYGYSNLNATYHAVATLYNLGYPVKSLKNTLTYVRSCEKPSGGFTVIPSSSTPYMEHVYYGVMTLNLLGEHAAYPEGTIRFILKCQNANGGFARSDLGISTFEDTFYAVSVLQIISKQW